MCDAFSNGQHGLGVDASCFFLTGNSSLDLGLTYHGLGTKTGGEPTYDWTSEHIVSTAEYQSLRLGCDYTKRITQPIGMPATSHHSSIIIDVLRASYLYCAELHLHRITK